MCFRERSVDVAALTTQPLRRGFLQSFDLLGHSEKVLHVRRGDHHVRVVASFHTFRSTPRGSASSTSRWRSGASSNQRTRYTSTFWFGYATMNSTPSLRTGTRTSSGPRPPTRAPPPDRASPSSHPRRRRPCPGRSRYDLPHPQRRSAVTRSPRSERSSCSSSTPDPGRGGPPRGPARVLLRTPIPVLRRASLTLIRLLARSPSGHASSVRHVSCPASSPPRLRAQDTLGPSSSPSFTRTDARRGDHEPRISGRESAISRKIPTHTLPWNAVVPAGIL